MPTFPDDYRIPVTRSLQTFNHDALTTRFDPEVSGLASESAFVRYCLAGVSRDAAGRNIRINIDPTKDCVRHCDMPFTITHDFDSLIGIVNNFPFTESVAFFRSHHSVIQ